MSDKVLDILRFLPRIRLQNVQNNKHAVLPLSKRPRGQHGGKYRGRPHKGAKAHNTFVRVGFEYGNLPFYLRTPKEPYNLNMKLRRQYPPLSLQEIQLMIDTGRLDASQPIDVGTLFATQLYNLNTMDRHFGVQLTEKGLDQFTAKINIEVQHAPEHVIAAIERNGGVVTSAYYDIISLNALLYPFKHFEKGKPIPKRLLPPDDAIGPYTDPKLRGYLADPQLIAKERLALSQKYGYKLPDISQDAMRDVLMLRKDPRQIFYGLRPGWLINVKDKTILEPLDPKVREYYEMD